MWNYHFWGGEINKKHINIYWRECSITVSRVFYKIFTNCGLNIRNMCFFYPQTLYFLRCSSMQMIEEEIRWKWMELLLIYIHIISTPHNHLTKTTGVVGGSPEKVGITQESNSRPSACWADVLTITPRSLLSESPHKYIFFSFYILAYSIGRFS